MFEMSTESQFHNAFKEDERAMLMPLVEVARFAGSIVLKRAPKGRGADNRQFMPYVEPRKGRYWTSPGDPEPTAGRLFKRGDRSCYPSYKAYKAALGVTSRDYKKTGTMWRSLRVKVMSPTKARVGFSGKNKKGLSNAKLAKIITFRETRSILDLGKKDVDAITRFMETALPASYLDSLKYEQMSFNARKKLDAAKRKLNQTKNLMAKARGEV